MYMVEYNSQFEKVSIGGTLYKLNTAERMVEELEEAVKIGKFHQELDDDIKYNNRALNHLFSPSEKDYILELDISISTDGSIPEEEFTEIMEDRELGSDMRVVTGEVQALDVKKIHDNTEDLISFEVKIPN